MQFHFPLYLVGGSIRDYLLQKTPNDFDFATKALPQEILAILKDYTTFRSGEKYGTIGVIFEGIKCEITTFRCEGEYLDNRHPSNVSFCEDIKMDLSRRDFSINALAYDICKDEMIDIFGGLNDLENKLICCIGNANERLKEDSLRILRAFVLVANNNFHIKQTTLQSIIELKYLLNEIKIERIRSEVNKIFASYNPKKALQLMKQHNILAVKYIPSQLNKIPPHLRIYLAFMIFSHLDYLTPSMQKKTLQLQNIIKEFTLLPHKSHDIKAKIAYIVYKFGFEDTKKAIIIKANLSKKGRILTKYFNTLRIYPPKINGNDIKKIGFNVKDIQKIKDSIWKATFMANLSKHQYHKILYAMKNSQI